MRILILGATGQVGWELMRAMQPLGEVIGAARSTPVPELVPVDLESPDSIRRVIGEIRPGLVVNTAAYTEVDRAEKDLARAAAVNGIAPGIVAEAAKACGAAVIHYSTDYVFDGRKAEPYREDDHPNPLSVYGRTKLEGEQAVITSGAAHLILRTSWVFGTRGRNFLLTMRRLMRERQSIRVVNDQIGAPTWSRLLAEATAQIVAQGSSRLLGYLEERSGLYHLTCAGRASWFEFAELIASAMPRDKSAPVADVLPIASAAYPQAASRPIRSLLDSGRLFETFGIRLPDWRIGAQLVLDELASADRATHPSG